MKRKFISVSTVAIIAIVATSLSVIGTVRGQEPGAPIGDNPHLRAQTAPTAGTTTTVKLNQKDVNFIQKAAGGGQQEVENGKLAEKQGQSADVKRIGARMVADHTKVNQELSALATRKGVAFNTKGVKAQNIPTAGFDRQYLMLLEQDHKSDIADFEKQAKNGDDRELKAWASKTVPILRQHLAMVEDALKKIK
jgi:putative membrane protein